MMKTILRNIRYSFRLLFKNPGFTLVAIITLGIYFFMCYS